MKLVSEAVKNFSSLTNLSVVLLTLVMDSELTPVKDVMFQLPPSAALACASDHVPRCSAGNGWHTGLGRLCCEEEPEWS